MPISLSTSFRSTSTSLLSHFFSISSSLFAFYYWTHPQTQTLIQLHTKMLSIHTHTTSTKIKTKLIKIWFSFSTFSVIFYSYFSRLRPYFFVGRVKNQVYDFLEMLKTEMVIKFSSPFSKLRSFVRFFFESFFQRCAKKKMCCYFFVASNNYFFTIVMCCFFLVFCWKFNLFKQYKYLCVAVSKTIKVSPHIGFAITSPRFVFFFGCS